MTKSDYKYQTSIKKWVEDYPLIAFLQKEMPVFWVNFEMQSYPALKKLKIPFSSKDIEAAHQRWQRFAPFLQEVFPETSNQHGLIESPFRSILHFQRELEALFDEKIPGKLYAKFDSHLPVAGSIKARGGIYEVLKIAEDLALNSKLLKKDLNYKVLTEPRFKNYFKQYTILTGSTGNLGLSIGLMAQALGFQAEIHMSNDAKAWKKHLLTEKKVKIIEHDGDYTQAVAKAREIANNHPMKFFIDDEDSDDLFLGYATAGQRLQQDLEQNQIIVDAEHPLIVYLPCGVGSSPGGITFGLKEIYGNNVHCIYVEPTQVPSMLLGIMTHLHHNVSVTDFGITGSTDADGLACNQPHKKVGKWLENFISGIYTLSDQTMYALLYLFYQSEEIAIEPSGTGSLLGPMNSKQVIGEDSLLWLKNLENVSENITHVCWLTGGSMVPADVRQKYMYTGEKALSDLIKELKRQKENNGSK